jgi:hypothetical protein
MGRGAARMLQVAILLVNRTNRKEFYRDGSLIAFPSLGYLAAYGNMSEKTAQRGIADLEMAGLLKSTHRYNGSNLYHLTVPPLAEQNYFEREELDRERRKRRRASVQTDGFPSVRTSGQMGAETGQNPPKCPPNLDLTPDSNPFTKWPDEGSGLSEDKKVVGEEERQIKEARESPGISPDFFSSLGSAIPDLPRRDAYNRARKRFGDRIGPIIAKAEQRGVPLDEIHHCIDTVIGDGGSVDDLAHALLHGGEYW